MSQKNKGMSDKGGDKFFEKELRMARGQTGFVEGKISRCCCRPTFWYLCPIFRKRLYGVCARGDSQRGF